MEESTLGQLVECNVESAYSLGAEIEKSKSSVISEYETRRIHTRERLTLLRDGPGERGGIRRLAIYGALVAAVRVGDGDTIRRRDGQRVPIRSPGE